jgi:hypothetical protein
VSVEERLGLLRRAWEAVEEVALLVHLGRIEGVLDDTEHDVVGHQLAVLHVRPGEAAELGVHPHVAAQRGAGREVHQAELSREVSALRTLPRSWATDDDEASTRGHGVPSFTSRRRSRTITVR